ncbi:SGNH hydrolase-type esterase domain-containing protein [Lasiosphaeria miniovina]|uniref:SGNH hydrolase-type esterase domain-containing protein n=1 Tax=Lasiosphaeria miniovina TaxID=1954250 RepID=A0AA40AME9_9PEZI|nr:SGNH hydrolase-type esterase domain-containing protein [Lasiosphaeria miniovina]KAK0718540.1 SGNH hydrolase-type esterase domain-containing protein [Lasiosphaeria miniovina]
MLHTEIIGIIAALVLPLLVQGAKLRYMPFGDSITDYECWRAWIGLHSKTNCSSLDWDRDHEGHPGYQAADIVAQNQLVDWLKQNPADIVTMHLGTNDICQVSRKTPAIVAALGTLIDQMRASNPAMRIIMAQIIPLPAVAKAVQELNAAIPALAASKNSTASPIWLVDQWTNFTAADLKDGIHPSASGDVKMADGFYPALVQAIKSLKAAA